MNTRGRLLKFCSLAGLPGLEPIIRIASGESPRDQMAGLAQYYLLPLFTIGLFLAAWSAAAKTVVSGSSQLPGPLATIDAGRDLFRMHFAQRGEDAIQQKAHQTLAAESMAKANFLTAEAASASTVNQGRYQAAAENFRQQALTQAAWTPSAAPTFVDQILTSLKTVFLGFAIATIVAVPIGILCGINPWFNAALTPLIQVFKPVSPLAWLPLAGLVVVWAYSGTNPEDNFFQKSFLISATTVSLCSLWPTLVNTTLGVASVDKDFMNVAKVLRLSWSQQLFKIILPASLPLMFAGLRISLGVGWMVLIAADMLAQNPGLGKFVWDEFQNGSNTTYARIAFSVLTIGLLGLLLDRVMICLRNIVSFGNPAVA